MPESLSRKQLSRESSRITTWEDLLRRMRDNEIRAEGFEEGLEEGQNKFGELVHILIEQGRREDVGRACTDPEYRDRLYREFQIS